MKDLHARYPELTGEIVDGAIKVHSSLGPGLLEGIYEASLGHELRDRGLKIKTQVSVPVVYNGVRLGTGFRVDLWVEQKVIVELKAVEKLLPIHKAQILSYLKLTETPVGLLLNFNVVRMKDGIKRFTL